MQKYKISKQQKVPAIFREKGCCFIETTVAHFYSPSDVRVLNFGVRKMLYDCYDVNPLLSGNHLQDKQIADDIMQ